MKNTLISIAAASVFTLLLASVQLAVAGGGANRGESGVVELQMGKPVSELPPANNQLSGTEPPQTPPKIITHVHPSGISVAGVYLDVPNAECGHLIEHALRQNQEIHVADEYCRNLMRQALEIRRNAPPEEAQQGIWRETPPPPLTMLIAGVPLDVPSEACARLIAEALQRNQEVDTTDAACRDKMQQALEIQSNPPPAGPAQQPMTGTSALEAVPFAKHLPNSQ